MENHHHHHEDGAVHVVEKAALAAPGAGGTGAEAAAAADAEVKLHDHADQEVGHQDSHDMEGNHSIIGITLVTGFIFMLLVDQMGGSLHAHSVPGNLVRMRILTGQNFVCMCSM